MKLNIILSAVVAALSAVNAVVWWIGYAARPDQIWLITPIIWTVATLIWGYLVYLRVDIYVQHKRREALNKRLKNNW